MAQSNRPAGKVVRKGGFGYLPQDPRIAGVLDGRTAVTHVLSGRGIDDELMRIEKLRLAMEEQPDERNVARYSRAEETFRIDGGYAAESEARSLAAGLGLGDDRIDLPIGVLSGGERRRVELARILFAGSDVLCLDEPTNHLDIDAKEWLMGFLRQYRGALLVISHDLDLLDEAITRVLHLDRPTEDAVGHVVEYKGTYSQYLAARAEDERRLAKQAALQDQGDRPAADVRRSLRRQGDEGVAGPQHGEAHRPPRGRSCPRTARRPSDCGAVPRPADAAVRRWSTAHGLCKGYGGPPVFEDVDFDLGRGERLLVLGLNGAGKTSLLRILAGETDGRSRVLRLRPQRHRRVLRPGARQPAHRRQSLLDNIRAEVPPGIVLTETAAARPARHDGPLGREGVPGGGHAVGRREDQARAGDADGRTQQPAAARRADQQPRSRRRARRSPTRSDRGRARSSSSATTPSSSSSSRRPRCC